MLYLIGGPPRMGKSTLAQKLLSEKKVAYVSTDGLTVMLKPAGVPSFYDKNKSEKFFPYFQQFIERMIPVGPDYTVEGDAFTPAHAHILSQSYDVRTVFLGMSNISVENIRAHAKHDKWIENVTPMHLVDLKKRIEAASSDIKAECAKLGIPYFDLALGYNEQFDKAYRHLTRI